MGNVYKDQVVLKIESEQGKDRKLLIYGEVDEDMATKFLYFVDRIIGMDKVSASEDRDVTIIVNSCGGSVLDGNAIIYGIDKLKANGFRVVGINVGCAASMAMSILVNCDYRIGGKLSNYLVHPISYGCYGNLVQHEDQLEFSKRLWRQMKQYYIENTKITEEKLDDIYDKGKDFWFDSEVALELGMIHEIA